MFPGFGEGNFFVAFLVLFRSDFGGFAGPVPTDFDVELLVDGLKAFSSRPIST